MKEITNLIHYDDPVTHNTSYLALFCFVLLLVNQKRLAHPIFSTNVISNKTKSIIVFVKSCIRQ
jgi:hypothetical protein